MVYKILLVEDEDTMRRLMKMLLIRKGHQVIEASDGEQATSMAVQEQPDLILLDIMMPGVDGFEALRRLRANPETENIPAIFLSAKSQVEDRVEGLRLGADDYLVKPADPDELAARIEAVMARSRREFTPRKGQLFGFVGARGGVGTTTLVANLGAHCHQGGQRTLLVDLHLAFGNLADQFDLAPARRSTADLVIIPPDEIKLDDLNQAVFAHRSGVRLLAGPASVPRGITFSAEHLNSIVEKAAYSAQQIFIDLPLDPDIIEVTAEHLDGVILVVGSEPSSLSAGVHAAEHLGHLGLHNRLGAVLVNRVPGEYQYVTGNQVSEQIGCLFLGSVPYRPKLYLSAEYNRTPVVLGNRESADQTIFTELAEKLFNYAEITTQFRKRQHMEKRHLI